MFAVVLIMGVLFKRARGSGNEKMAETQHLDLPLLKAHFLEWASGHHYFWVRMRAQNG